jgi:hypothetical protein
VAIGEDQLTRMLSLMNFDNQTGVLVVTPLGGSDAENTSEGATTLLPALVVKIH